MASIPIPITGANYSGKELTDVFWPRLMEQNSLFKLGMRNLPGYKDKATFWEIGTDAEIISNECKFESPNSFSGKQKTVEICPIALPFEECNKALLGTIRSRFMAQGFAESAFTDDSMFTAALMGIAVNRFVYQLNDLLIRGDKTLEPANPTYLDKCDGIVTKALASADTVKASNPEALTDGNIITKVNQFITDAITGNESIVYGPNGIPVLMMSIADFQLYAQVRAGDASAYPLQVNSSDGMLTATIPGQAINMVAIPSWPKNTMMLVHPSNIGLFMDDSADLNKLVITNVAKANALQDFTTMLISAAVGIDLLVDSEAAIYQPAP